jgi:hypothetical protein
MDRGENLQRANKMNTQGVGYGVRFYAMETHARNLERERDEARELCRWAFPRLRAMSEDLYATGTTWACEDFIAQHPEIFSNEPTK